MANAGLSFVVIILLTAVAPLSADHLADLNFKPQVDNPAFAEGNGPVVLIDEAHNNFHTIKGRFRPFADLLRRDGYVLTGSTAKFTYEALENGQILVIANALSERNLTKPGLPTFSAFTPEEIVAVQAWVRDGGSLLLIADHMPWAGAAEQLAAAFGFLFSNGYAIAGDGATRMTFRREDESLQNHATVRGRNSQETIDFVTTFLGQAFRVRRGVDARPVMIFHDGAVLRMTIRPGKYSSRTPRISASGMFQGATLQYGSAAHAVGWCRGTTCGCVRFLVRQWLCDRGGRRDEDDVSAGG